MLGSRQIICGTVNSEGHGDQKGPAAHSKGTSGGGKGPVPVAVMSLGFGYALAPAAFRMPSAHAVSPLRSHSLLCAPTLGHNFASAVAASKANRDCDKQCDTYDHDGSIRRRVRSPTE